jgi:hypothetical protein
MRLKIALPLVLAAGTLLAGCSSDTTNGNAGNSNTGAATNTNSSPRNGVVETNVNMPANTNGNTVSSNTAVLTNNNGNKNTAGVSSMNTNGHNNSNTHSNGNKH